MTYMRKASSDTASRVLGLLAAVIVPSLRLYFPSDQVIESYLKFPDHEREANLFCYCIPTIRKQGVLYIYS